jgi:4-hydroxy-tetrahydrodipicolinate synthase
MADAFDDGDIETAGRIHRDLQALFTALFAHPSPIPVKWAMNEYGFKAGECRPPMGPMPEDLKAVMRPLIAPYRPE